MSSYLSWCSKREALRRGLFRGRTHGRTPNLDPKSYKKFINFETPFSLCFHLFLTALLLIFFLFSDLQVCPSDDQIQVRILNLRNKKNGKKNEFFFATKSETIPIPAFSGYWWRNSVIFSLFFPVPAYSRDGPDGNSEQLA